MNPLKEIYDARADGITGNHDGDPEILSVADAHIAELTKQRDALARKVALLSAIVREVPSIILNARLDQAEGKPTKYDYTRHGNALNAREF